MKFDVMRSESTVLHVFPFNSEKKQGGIAVKLNLTMGWEWIWGVYAITRLGTYFLLNVPLQPNHPSAFSLLCSGLLTSQITCIPRRDLTYPNKPNSEVHLHWKGTVELVLASFTTYLNSDGVVSMMDDNKGEIRLTLKGKDGCSSSENNNLPTAKTPNLIARLMGLDLLPDRSPSEGEVVHPTDASSTNITADDAVSSIPAKNYTQHISFHLHLLEISQRLLHKD